MKHYYYAESVEHGPHLQNLENLDDRGWLNRTVGAALGSGAMRIVHWNRSELHNPVPRVPSRFSELAPQAAYTVYISKEDPFASGVIVPITSPDTVRHGTHWLSKVPEVPIVYRDESGLVRLTGMVFADPNTPKELGRQLGVEVMSGGIPPLQG